MTMKESIIESFLTNVVRACDPTSLKTSNTVTQVQCALYSHVGCGWSRPYMIVVLLLHSEHPFIFKSWWTNKEKGEWGAFYLFNSEKDLQEYINSDLWLKTVPAKYGAKPVQTILDPGPILCKKTITDAMTSWITD